MKETTRFSALQTLDKLSQEMAARCKQNFDYGAAINPDITNIERIETYAAVAAKISTLLAVVNTPKHIEKRAE